MSHRLPSRGRKPVRDLNASAAQGSELSRHLLLAQEEERKRISRELHDEAGQGLMALRLHLAMLASESQNPESQPKIEQALAMLDRTIGDLRRIIARLSPRTLEELGLLAAIRREARELSKNTGMKAQLCLPQALDQLDHEIEIALYRSVQEALHNIAKHSQAKNFSVQVEINDGMVDLRVQDDGIGFSGKGNARLQTFGLLGMRERIAALGGTVRIRSRKGQGTRLRVVLPVRHAAATRKQSVRVEAGHIPLQRGQLPGNTGIGLHRQFVER